MLVPILLAIIGLIVGLGLGFMVAKARHEKEIDGAQNTARGIITHANKEAETLKKEALLEAKEENQQYRAQVERKQTRIKITRKSLASKRTDFRS